MQQRDRAMKGRKMESDAKTYVIPTVGPKFEFFANSAVSDKVNMEALLQMLQKCAARAEALNVQLSQKFSMKECDVPISAFNMAHQKFVLSIEQVSAYLDYWSRHPAPYTNHATELNLQDEKRQRMVAITRTAFIGVMSSMEFCAKETFALYPLIFPEKKDRIYFGWILNESEKLGIIQATDIEPWKGVIELRNTLVHNNGISDITKSYTVPGTSGIHFSKGAMSRGDLSFFPRLILWMIEAYARWCVGSLTLVGK